MGQKAGIFYKKEKKERKRERLNRKYMIGWCHSVNLVLGEKAQN